jgi:hypothetical protein
MKEDANNYHSIALVQSLSKILENVTANRIISFDKHNILNIPQFGFRKN